MFLIYIMFIREGKNKLIFIFFTFTITFFFVLSSSILVLLVFRNKVVHVRFSFSELHLVHTFTSVPVKKGLSAEHKGELFRHTFEHFLDGGGVTNKGGSHLQTLWWDITHRGFDVVRDPFNEV